MLDLHKLLSDVFDPQPGETATVVVDMPHGSVTDSTAWQERRAMAERWRTALAEHQSVAAVFLQKVFGREFNPKSRKYNSGA